MKLGIFIQRIFTEPDGNPSNKRVIATYATFVYSTILMAAFFFAIPLNEAVVHMSDVLLGTALGTYVIGRYAEPKGFVPPTGIPDNSPTKTVPADTQEAVTPEESTDKKEEKGES